MAEGIASPSWRLLLLGGTTASGKSTSGRLVAHRLGISCISADSIWKALQEATSPATHPAFHHFEPSPEVYARGPDHLAELHAEAAEAMTEALNTFIDWELHDGNRFVFEGAWITPALAARRLRSSELLARAIFIDEPEERAILTSMLERSKRIEPLPRQLEISAMAWRYGNRIREQANKYSIPTVMARPRETLVERIIEAAG